MLHTFTVNAVNTPAKAKVIFNKKHKTVKVVVAFNVHKKLNNKSHIERSRNVTCRSSHASTPLSMTLLLPTFRIVIPGKQSFFCFFRNVILFYSNI